MPRKKKLYKNLKAQLPDEMLEWVRLVEANAPGYRVCKDQIKLLERLEEIFTREKIFFDNKRFEGYLKLIERYIPYMIYPWETFLIGLHLCCYKAPGKPRFPKMFCMIGRGAGKDGLIAMECLCLSSPINGIDFYNCDICAVQEEQAVRPLEDLRNSFERPGVEQRIKKFYHWTKQIITCTTTKSVVKGHTNNPAGRDGLRPGIVIFNEVHAYTDYKNIKVFKTGKGKVAEPRELYVTSNGEIRDMVLDDYLKDAEAVLNGEKPDGGWLYFICRLDDENELQNEADWVKANPSLPYNPTLLDETRDEYREWLEYPERNMDFPIKRMGLSKTVEDACAAEWEDIAATNKPLIDLAGRKCTCGIDYAKTSDWVGVNLHFNVADKRYDINHAFVCDQSRDLKKVKAPWREWEKAGLLTVIHAPEISPDTIAEYVADMGKKYRIKKVAIDKYRFTLLEKSLSRVGFSFAKKNVTLIKTYDIIQYVPVIDHLFKQRLLYWGDNPVLRWATNNTKCIRYGRDKGADKGSFTYAKIDAASRKTDPFMAFVMSVCVELDAEPEVHRHPGGIDVCF